MKLHLACGTNILSGWTNVDLEPIGAGVIQHDLTQHLPFPDDSADFIYSEHFIEHIPKESAYAFVSQCFNKLKPGGTIRISTPNLARLVRQYEQGRVDGWHNVGWEPETLADMLNEGMTSDGRRYLYDVSELEKILKMSGFHYVTPQKWGVSRNEEFNQIESRPDSGEIILEASKPQEKLKHPRVSIVMPSYNHEAYVGAAIDSVLNQTFQDFELVITDDGSSDRTADIIASYTDPRIKFNRSTKNKGISWSLNDAIRRSQGEYIACLASDDEFLEHKLKVQVEFLDAHPEIGAVFAYPRMIDEVGKNLPTEEQAKQVSIFYQENRTQTEWLLRLFQGNCLCAPTVMVRRSCHDAIGLYSPSLRSLQDHEMWVRLLQITNIHIMKETLIRKRIFKDERHESGNRPDQLRRGSWEIVKILKRYLSLPDSLWYPMISGLVDVSMFSKLTSYKRELEFVALCTQLLGGAQLIAAMQVLESIEDESDENVIPINKIYNELTANIGYNFSIHKDFLTILKENL